ncbi:MAG TPA: 5'/3'-nucleotidase SurE [Mycobacteriales bacterium]|nr:5'/3'-nucleotidase SurE [Mycobacteriales bacterium]
MTNDDGIDSDGIRTLAAAALEAGLDVVVAAPSVEHSGSSAALTSRQVDGGLVLERRPLDGTGVTAYAVHAAPAYIAFVGARGAFGAKPDIVLSGINHGPNTGYAILHSGTVGAALTAATQGLPAVAFSMASAHPRQWDTAADVVKHVLRTRPDHDGPTVLNVNIPDVPAAELRGVRSARLAARGAVQARVVQAEGDLVRLSFDETVAESGPESDASLLRQSWATVTALQAPCENAAVDVSDVLTG